LRRREDDGDLLPAGLSGAGAAGRPMPLLSERCGRRGGGVQAMFTLSAGESTGSGDRRRYREAGAERGGSDRGGCDERWWPGTAGCITAHFVASASARGQARVRRE